jgi:hypothetical protein
LERDKIIVCCVWGLEALGVLFSIRVISRVAKGAVALRSRSLSSMEAASEGEDRNQSNDHNNNNSNSKFGNSSEGQSKPKRQMKTPFQLETLEKAYASTCTGCCFFFPCVFMFVLR